MPQIQIDPALIERFGRMMRENFSIGSVPFRKAYLQSLIEGIEVDDTGPDQRKQGRARKGCVTSQAGEIRCSQMSTKWRAGRDSNP